jgi:hypothetical protein
MLHVACCMLRGVRRAFCIPSHAANLAGLRWAAELQTLRSRSLRAAVRFLGATSYSMLLDATSYSMLLDATSYSMLLYATLYNMLLDETSYSMLQGSTTCCNTVNVGCVSAGFRNAAAAAVCAGVRLRTAPLFSDPIAIADWPLRAAS